MKTLRVAVTGGRAHEITEKEAEKLEEILSDLTHQLDNQRTTPAVVLIHGNCKGVDQRAAELAEEWGFPTFGIRAPWESMKRLLGKSNPKWKAAGAIRNWQLLQAADLLIAFPGGKGTADCVRQAKKLGVRVVEIKEGG